MGYRCTMVTIEQRPTAQCGTRPFGQVISSVLKSFRTFDESTHGPLPRTDPNFGVFATLDQESAAVLRVGDLVSPTGIGSAKSIYAYSLAASLYSMTFNENRFW